jgi:hypothetical protein
MNWYYESNGLQQGPVSESELMQLISLGRISKHNLLWRKGMHDWTPLGDVQDFSTRLLDSSAPPSLANSLTTETPSAVVGNAPSAGTEGDAHRGLPSASEPAERDFGDFEGALRGIEAAEDATPHAPAWEEDSRGGGIRSFVVSAYEILLRPGTTFSNINHRGGWGSPLSFYLISNVLGIFFAIRTTLEIASKDPNLTPKMMEALKQMPTPTAPDILISSLISSCLLCPLVLVFATGVLHLSMMICGAANRPVSTTFRVVAYATGAGSTLWLLPSLAVWATGVAGEDSAARIAYTLSLLVAMLWSVSVLVLGLARAQNSGIFRAAVAVFLPLALTVGAPLIALVAAIASKLSS